MHCTLLIPGLFWPRAGADEVARGLEVPALRRLLARSEAQRFAPVTPEGWLCQAFQIERGQDWPVAPLTLELDGGEPDDAYWLRADPVHLKIERHRLLLVDNALFHIAHDEAQALAATLNAHFEREGLAFHAPHPKRWYVKLPRTPALLTHSMNEAAGHDVKPYLPEGADALEWHGVFNEAQMLLHAHAVNVSREERGEPAVNSVWFWGGGRRQMVRGRPFGAVWANDAVATAIGAEAEASAVPLPRDAAAFFSAAADAAHEAESHLLVIDSAANAAAYGDKEGWRERLSRLEAQWFVPLLDALRTGRVTGLAIVVPGPETCLRFDVARLDLYKIWRQLHVLSAYA